MKKIKVLFLVLALIFLCYINATAGRKSIEVQKSTDTIALGQIVGDIGAIFEQGMATLTQGMTDDQIANIYKDEKKVHGMIQKYMCLKKKRL